MPSILLDTWRGGQAPYDDRGYKGAGKLVRNLDIRKPLDSLSCQQKITEEFIGTSTPFDALPRFIVPCSDGSDYAFLSNGKIYKRDRTTKQWALVYTESNESGNIIGAIEAFEGTQSFLYWATPTRLNRKPIAGASNWSDVNTGGSGSWPKTTLTSATWHTMARVTSQLLIGNGDKVARVSMLDSSFTTTALQVSYRNNIKAIIESGFRAIIGTTPASKVQEAALFLWGLVSSNSWDNKNVIRAYGVNGFVETDNLYVQAGDKGFIYYADFDSVSGRKKPLFQFPGGGIVNPDGVDADDNLALWGVFDNDENNNGIYTFGAKIIGENRTLALDYWIDDVTEIGSVKKCNDEILVSWKDDSNAYHIGRVDSTLKATGLFQTIDLKAPPDIRLKGKIPTWTKVVITTKPMPASTTIAFARQLDKNETTGFLASNTQNGSTSWGVTGATEAQFLLGDGAKIIEGQFTLTPSGNNTPEILKAELFFE